MLLKTSLEKEVFLSYTSKTEVVFKDGIQLTVVPEVLDKKTCIFRLENFSSDFEVTTVCHHANLGVNIFDKNTKTFKRLSQPLRTFFKIFISLDVEFKEVNYVEIEYKLQFPGSRIKLLELFDYYSIDFELPGYEYLQFKCYIRKVKEGEVILTVENLYDLRIEGKKGNFEFVSNHNADIDRLLTFVFDPQTVYKAAQEHLPSESRPDSVLSSSSEASTTVENQFISKISMHDLLSDSKYADAIFISSDKIRIPSQKSVIAKHSKNLAKFFETSKTNPTEICVFGNAETITAALDFCYGKDNSFKGNEALMIDVWRFAYNYGFTELQEACCTQFEKIINPKNVCEIIQIAYNHKYEGLKEKCKQILIKKKAEIDQAKLKDVSKDILFDLFDSY
uniref:BTB domain-containing protein n=1 Tax=Panagrolaimus sp. ES5 TaxID=591445 RepID=A0AC34F867_9BILA